MSNIIFDDETIQAIFGHEAAEDEDRKRLREYYFKSQIFSRMNADLPLRILVGHKGTGKSALISVAMSEDRDAGLLALLIRPDDVHEIGTSDQDVLASISSWKAGLLRIIYTKCLNAVGLSNDGDQNVLVNKSVRFVDRLTQVFKPLIDKHADISEMQQALAVTFLKRQKVRVYLDDLDRGWTATPGSILRLSALLNALRDLSNEHLGLQFRVAMRSDVYFLVRTSDESTDKIEGSVVWHSWTNHEILAMLVKRIEAYHGRIRNEAELIGMEQGRLASFLDSVIAPRFLGKGKWQNIPVHRMLMSVIRRRPRDLVKLCTLAAQDAHTLGSSIISTQNFDAIFDRYSQGRLRDTVNEFRSELADIEVLLLNMRPSGQKRYNNNAHVYNTAELLKKIKDIQSSNKPFFFYGGRPAGPKELAAFMYKVNFLTARRDQGDVTVRRYFEEQNYLSSSFTDFGFDWEVHPAYRWALQPDTTQDVLLSMQPSSDEEK